MKIRNNPDFSKNFTLYALTTIVLINLVFRYPRMNYPSGIDGIFITALSNTINSIGEIGWFISPFSLLGFYPFSYAAGFPVVLAAISQLLELTMFQSILVIAFTLSILGTLSSFMMAKAMNKGNFFAIFFSFLFSTAPLFIRFTSWQASTRTILIAFIPLIICLVFMIRRNSRVRLRLSILFLVIMLLALSFHRAANLLALVFLSFLISIFLNRKKGSLSLPKFRVNFVGIFWFALIIIFVILQAYKVGTYEAYNLGLKYETGRFFEGEEGHIIIINMLIDYGSRTGLFSPFVLAGLFAILHQSTYRKFDDIFILLVFLCFSWILTFGLYVSLVLLPFICFLVCIGIIYVVNNFSLFSKNKVTSYSMFIISTIIFSNLMLSSWGTYDSTTNNYEYDSALFSKEYIKDNETSVTDGDWGSKIFTVSDGMYMRDDVTPLPMTYGWLSEEYTSTKFNFDDVIIRKTILDNDESTQDFEEYWEDLAIRIYSNPVEQTVLDRNLFNINYAFNHKLIDINDYEIITSSEASRYCLFENDEIEIFKL